MYVCMYFTVFSTGGVGGVCEYGYLATYHLFSLPSFVTAFRVTNLLHTHIHEWSKKEKHALGQCLSFGNSGKGVEMQPNSLRMTILLLINVYICIYLPNIRHVQYPFAKLTHRESCGMITSRSGRRRWEGVVVLMNRRSGWMERCSSRAIQVTRVQVEHEWDDEPLDLGQCGHVPSRFSSSLIQGSEVKRATT